MDIFDKLNLKWHFPGLDNGEADGFNDPILQYFEGKYERFVAREAIQNSSDARFDNGVPLAVEFEYLQVDAKEIPGLNELKDRINACLSRSVKNDDQKAVRFFDRALKILNQKLVPVLRIGDYNTKGLQGKDDDENGSWYKLVKAIGENRMSGAGGGSYGIGKGAPIAASLIHTVYYSTFNIDGEYIFQGRSRLITHEYKGDRKRGSGFFGTNGYESIRGEKNIPAEFLRKTTGTDIYVIGYEPDNENWKEEMIRSVLENFWMAIRDNDLIVKFKDGKEIAIDSNTLEKMILNYLPDDTYQYYLSVEKPTRDEEKALATLGTCHLWLRQDNELKDKRNVMMMRLPKMLVYRQPFRIMNDGFAGVFTCIDPEGNKLLRDLEPPKHDTWDTDLPSSPQEKTKAKTAMREVMEWIKSVLKEMSNSDAGDPQEIPDLDQFLPLDDGEGKGMSYDNTYGWNGVQKEESPREISAEKEDEFEDEVEDVVQKFNAIKKTSGMVPITTIDVQVDGGVGGDKNRIVTPGGIEGDKTVGEEKGEVITKINTNNIKYRIVAGRNTDGDLEYCLILNSQIDQNGSLNIIAVGDDNNYPMDIEFAKNWEDNSDFTVNGSRILNLTLEKDKGIKIKLMLKHPRIKYALGIESYEG